MPLIYKRLGALQSAGTIGTAQTLYTASSVANTSTVMSTISICNLSATATTYRIGINTTNTYSQESYLAFDAPLAANDTVLLTVGFVLDPTNRFLLVSGSTVNIAFQAFGAENS